MVEEAVRPAGDGSGERGPRPVGSGQSGVGRRTGGGPRPPAGGRPPGPVPRPPFDAAASPSFGAGRHGPRAPREVAADSPEPRTFLDGDGRAWVARVAGKGAAGTGGCGLAMVVAVQFAHADRPDEPLYEALQARGRFEGLFDAELLALLERAVRIERPPEP
jgi:hypothetical protein